MIYPDLTSILGKYRDWDTTVRSRYTRYTAALMKQHERVIYKGIEYHNIEDIQCALDAECIEEIEQ